MSIQARYGGECPECGERWQPGDLIRSERTAPGNRNIWQHAACPADAIDAVVRSACGTCWLERSVTGACGCDDDD